MSFHKINFPVSTSVKILKDNLVNRVSLIRLDADSSKLSNQNYSLLCDIIKEGEKYYFVPLINELGSDRETIKDVPWIIYNKKTEPQINSEYYLNEGDIIKLGNAIFKIRMIHIENLDKSKNKINNNDDDNNNDNNTLLIAGSSNHSLILNGQDNFDNITKLKTEKILVFPNNIENKREKLINKIEPKKERMINKICRICYQEEDESLTNPLIKPCKCSGSMKYIHLKCLLFWLKSKTIQHHNNSLEHNNFFNSYFINDRNECELCKNEFPDYLKHNHIKYCLLDFDYTQENKIKKINNIEQNYINTNQDQENNVNIKNNESTDTNGNFIVMDTLFPLNDGNKYRCIVKFNKENKILIGRGLENQLVLNEITVSRTHCLITAQRNKYGKKEIKLEDDGSKFGTLILLQSNRYEIIEGKPLHVQIGNLYFIFSIPTQKSFFSCCNVDVSDGKNSYEKINSQAVKNKYNIYVLTERNSDDDSDKDKDNNSEIMNNINNKNTENMNMNSINNYKIQKKLDKTFDNLDKNLDKTKEIPIKEENEDKKEEEVLYPKEQEEFKRKNKNKKNEDNKTEKDNTNDRDRDKKSVVVSLKKNIIEEINKEIKNAKTLPENNGLNLSKNSMKSIKRIKKIQIKEPSNKDKDSVIIVEDESSKI